jgi:hypothetical protein
MRESCTDRPRYTGAPMFPFAPMGHHAHGEPGGFCRSCCHPRRSCMCGQRECRREAKELLANSDTGALDKAANLSAGHVLLAIDAMKADGLAASSNAEINPGVYTRTGTFALAGAFIGGGCCVHLSVEYMANNPAQPSTVLVGVVDSEGTALIWDRTEAAGTPYQIKEGIITTKPGAKLSLIVSNATARVRWCEVFSC